MFHHSITRKLITRKSSLLTIALSLSALGSTIMPAAAAFGISGYHPYYNHGTRAPTQPSNPAQPGSDWGGYGGSGGRITSSSTGTSPAGRPGPGPGPVWAPGTTSRADSHQTRS